MYKKRMSFLAVAGGLVFALACGSSDAAPEGGLPADHPPIDGNTSVVPANAATQFAVVRETMDSGGYTYALLDLNGDEAWAAGPITALAVGDEVAVTGAAPMQNFTAKSLDRTFEIIYFVGAYLKKGDMPTGGMASDAAPAGGESFGGTVVEAIPAAGYTYLNVETEGGTIWLAAPAMQVAVGDEVAWQGGMAMQNFNSSSLNRTFDAILFVEAVAVK